MTTKANINKLNQTFQACKNYARHIHAYSLKTSIAKTKLLASVVVLFSRKLVAIKLLKVVLKNNYLQLDWEFLTKVLRSVGC